MRRATVIVDASFCQQHKVGGWAGWLRVDGYGLSKHHGKLRRDMLTDSTVAEVMAACNGVFIAARLGATHILLQSDAMAVVHLFSGAGKSPRLIWFIDDLRARLGDQYPIITTKHVKGHGPIHNARTWVNDWCDRHARMEMEQERHVARSHQPDRKKRVSSREGKARPDPSWSVCPRP